MKLKISTLVREDESLFSLEITNLECMRQVTYTQFDTNIDLARCLEVLFNMLDDLDVDVLFDFEKVGKP